MRNASGLVEARNGERRTGKALKRLLMIMSVGVLLCSHVEASSRPSPRHQPFQQTSSRRKRKRKKRIAPDPHDVSSSSPSFAPLIFTEDEREEDILSALARLETEGDDEIEAVKKPSVRKAKRIVKKAMSAVIEKDNEEHEPKQEEAATKAPSAIIAPASSDSKATESKVRAPSRTIVQHSVTALETMKRSPTKLATESMPDYPPRPVWNKRPEPQIVPNLPPMTSSVPPTARTMPSVHTPTTKYPFVPGSTVQTQPNQQQSQQANENSSTTSLWVRKFLSARPKDTLLPIPREYLSDGFNLVQLAPIVEKIGRMEGGYVPPAISSDTSFPLFKAALRLILSNDDGPTPLSVQRAAEVLYTLVHARYVISPRGLDTVRSVLRRSDGSVNPVFGRCPRIRCRGMPLIPYGDSDNFDARNSVSTRAKRYCSCCGEVRGLILPRWRVFDVHSSLNSFLVSLFLQKFYMWDSKADESAWGTSFCHLFLMIYGSTVFSDLHMEKSDAVTSTDVQQRIFGFQVHPASQLRYSFGD